MTTRQAIATRQSNKNLKVEATVMTGRKALVVKIDWTQAPVIKTTIRSNFKMSVLAMDTKKWTPIQRAMMNLKAGQVVHFVASDDHPGYYYITIVGESCTCVAGLYKQPCHHQADAKALQAEREMRQLATSTEPTKKYTGQEVNDFFMSLALQADQERRYANLSSVA